MDVPTSFTPCFLVDVLGIQEYQTHTCERAHPHECEEIPWRLMPGLRLKANQEWLMCNGYSGLHHRGLLSSDRLPAPLAGCLEGVWSVCPHVYPSVSGLGSERCGVKDGETGRCAAIRW